MSAIRLGTQFSAATRHCLLAGAGIAALLPALAHADEVAPDPLAAEAAEGAVDEIVVSGSILQAQAASVQAKRDALIVADIAAADAVGRFPDQNSAAALSRLPAVAVQRDQGQER